MHFVVRALQPIGKEGMGYGMVLNTTFHSVIPGQSFSPIITIHVLGQIIVCGRELSRLSPAGGARAEAELRLQLLRAAGGGSCG